MEIEDEDEDEDEDEEMFDIEIEFSKTNNPKYWSNLYFKLKLINEEIK